MASSATIDDLATKDPLDALLARLMAAAPAGKGVAGENSGVPVKTSKVGLTRGESHSEEHDPWKTLSDQVNDEISRQIYDELDKQLDAQMMSELEKCQDEQSRRMDEELDRQLQEQLDAMLEASLGNELRGDEQDEYEYYSDEDGAYSEDEEDEFEHLPWSEGGEGGIGSLGLGELLHEDGGDARSKPSAMFGAPRYSEEELQTMLDSLYGEGGGGKLVGPGAWGKGRWRPEGDASDST